MASFGVGCGGGIGSRQNTVARYVRLPCHAAHSVAPAQAAYKPLVRHRVSRWY
jgi:hypothetical protein